MWRLKIAEGGKDPYIYSTNNFVGRQTWEYDPGGGSAEERAQVDAARLHFYNNRFQVKPCGDLLWRFQVLTSILFYSILFLLFSCYTSPLPPNAHYYHTSPPHSFMSPSFHTYFHSFIHFIHKITTNCKDLR